MTRNSTLHISISNSRNLPVETILTLSVINLIKLIFQLHDKYKYVLYINIR